MKNKPKPRSFAWNYFHYFAHPGTTFASLLKDPRRVRFAVFAVLVPVVGYTLMYIFAWFGGGAPSTFKPWLAIPIEQYYKYDIFMTAPSILLCWVLASGSLQLIVRLFSDKGSFEDTATALGFGIGVAMWGSLIHDLTDSALGFFGVIDLKWYETALNSPTVWRALLWTLYSIYALWLGALFAKGLKAAHTLSWAAAVPLGVLGVIIFQGVYLVFNR